MARPLRFPETYPQKSSPDNILFRRLGNTWWKTRLDFARALNLNYTSCRTYCYIGNVPLRHFRVIQNLLPSRVAAKIEIIQKKIDILQKEIETIKLLAAKCDEEINDVKATRARGYRAFLATREDKELYDKIFTPRGKDELRAELDLNEEPSEDWITHNTKE